MTTKKKLTRRTPPGSVQGKRLYINLPVDLARAIRQEAASRRVPATQIITSQLAERYEPENADVRERMVLAELRALRREMAALKFQQSVIAEIVPLGFKSLAATLPSPTKEGHTRASSLYNFLVAEVEKALSTDRALVDRLAEKLLTFADADFADLPEGAIPDPDDDAALTHKD